MMTSEPDELPMPEMLEAGEPLWGLLSDVRGSRTSRDVADDFSRFISEARARIEGPGADQYETPDGQRFERMPLGDLFREAREELLDVAAYSFFLADRLESIRRRVMRRLISEAHKP